MKSRSVIISMLAVAVLLLSLLAFYVRVGVSADSVAVLKTRGMTCGSCSGTISKALETLKGVSVTEVDVEGGWVVVGYDTKTVKPAVLAETVTAAGFVCSIDRVLTPAQFEQITSRDIGKKAVSYSRCCGGKGGCGGNKTN